MMNLLMLVEPVLFKFDMRFITTLTWKSRKQLKPQEIELVTQGQILDNTLCANTFGKGINPSFPPAIGE